MSLLGWCICSVRLADSAGLWSWMVGEVERGWEDWPRCLSGSADVCGMPQRNHRKGRLLWGHGSAKCGFGFEGGAFSSRVIVLALALWWGFLAIGAKSRRDALVVRFAFGCEWCSRCMGFQAWRRVHGVGRESTRTEHVWGNPVSHCVVAISVERRVSACSSQSLAA